MPILAQDLDLIERAKAGEAAAFEQLVRRYQDRIHNALYRFLGDEGAAQDLAQETFLKAFLRLKEFRGDSQFYTWLYAISRNLAMSHRRSAASRARPVDLDGLPLQAEEGDPVRRALSRDRERAVQEALKALDPEARWLVILRDLEGRDYAEIAEIAGIPAGTVKSRLHRARLELRALLEGVLG